MNKVLTFIAAVAVIAFWFWLKWSQSKNQTRDLGDGGIQTLFDKNPK